MKRDNHLRLAAGCCLAGVLAAGPLRAAPTFPADRDYPEIGLRFRILGRATPEPLATPKTYTYTFTRGAESWKRDLFDPAELWYATQWAGQWRDASGNRLILGRASRMPPVFQTAMKHVPRDAFDQAMADAATAFDAERPEQLAAWVRAFSGCATEPAEPVRISSFALHNACFFPVVAEPVLIYAFRVKQRMPDGAVVPSDWFCAVLRVADGTSAATLRKTFESSVLAHVAALPKAGAPAARVAATSSAPVVGAQPGREAARKSIANLKDWWFAETPDYIFLSDIRSATGRALIRELQNDLPALRRACVRLVPPLRSEMDVSVVRICESEEAYRSYVGQEVEWSSGLWNPMRRELVVLSQGKDRDRTLAILRHEGFHQYLFYAMDQIETSAWFNEGHACFFEDARVDGKGDVTFTEGSRAEALLRRLDEAVLMIPQLLKTDAAAFYQGGAERRSLNYALAWGVVYFLRKGAPADRLSAYEAILPRYLQTLAATRDGAAATSAAFAPVDMRAFQKDFANFWKSGRGSARRYDPLNGPTRSP